MYITLCSKTRITAGTPPALAISQLLKNRGGDGFTHQGIVCHSRHARIPPTVGRMNAPETELEVVVCKGLGPGRRLRVQPGSCTPPQSNGGNGLARERLHERVFLSRREIPQDAVALAGYRFGNLNGEGGGRRPRPGGISEHMQVSEWEVFDQPAGFLEFGFGLAREPDHHVSANCRVWHGRTNFQDLFHVVCGTVFAVHAAKNAIAPR